MGDTKAHFKIKMNTMCSFGAIKPQSSDADASDDTFDTAVDDTDKDNYDIRKSDPYMPPSYAGDTKTNCVRKLNFRTYSCPFHEMVS